MAATASRGESAVCRGGDRTQLRLGCCRHALQSHPHRGRLAYRWCQDLVYLWRQGGCAAVAGTYQSDLTKGHKGSFHVSGGKALRWPRVQAPAGERRRYQRKGDFNYRLPWYALLRCLFFDNYFVPDENLLGGPGGEGRGFYFTMAGFAGGRIQTAARSGCLCRRRSNVPYPMPTNARYSATLSISISLPRLNWRALPLTCWQAASSPTLSAVTDGSGQEMEASMVKFFTCKTAEWVTRGAADSRRHGLRRGDAGEAAISWMPAFSRSSKVWRRFWRLRSSRALIDRAGETSTFSRREELSTAHYPNRGR